LTILDRVPTARDPELPGLAKDLAGIRAARYQKWPQLKAQDNAEAIEGTARYLEHAYKQLAPSIWSAPENGSLTEALDKVWDLPEEQNGLGYSAYYSTGSLLALLLDRIAPSWKHDIEPSPSGKGWTPGESLRQATGITTAPKDSVVAEIEAKYLDAPSNH
jgi:hypothetical protein